VIQEYRHLHLVGATGSKLRTSTFNNAEHLVVPVVAMVEGVVWAINSEVPEFIPAEELAETPQQWNGRACFAGHPEVKGSQVTANTPDILEKSFGVIFNTTTSERILKTRRLEFEAWLDPVRAEAVGPDAVDVIRRLRAGEAVEVSIGTFVEVEQKDGEFQGKEFHGIWRNLVSDHNAFLPVGTEGACSIAAGCGAPRTAVRHLITAEGIAREDRVMAEKLRITLDPEEKRGLLSRILGVFRENKATEGVSDRDLRRSLDAALRAIEPGFMGVDEVFPAESQVIYSVNPTDKWQTMRRGYSTNKDGAVTLKDNAEEVEPIVSYQAVKTAEGAPAPSTACGCGKTTTIKGAENMKEEVKKIIEGSAGRFTDADATWLENVPADRLAALTPVPATEVKPAATPAVPTPVATPAATPEPVDEPKAAAAAPVQKTEAQLEEEFMKAAPESLRTLIERQRAAETKKRNELVASLKTAQTVYTEAELTAMPVEQLEKVAALAHVEQPADYSGRGVPRVADGKDTFTPPNPYDAALKARKPAAVN